MLNKSWETCHGSAFSGEYAATLDDKSPDPESWQDNIVFPNGGSEPAYISGWEWMFEIFDVAREADNITDGYNMILYYPGYRQPANCFYWAAELG